MPIDHLSSIQEGLDILQSSNDFFTNQDLIRLMAEMCPDNKLPLLKDNIARVLKQKLHVEMQQMRNFPNIVLEIEQKYRDLSKVLKFAGNGKNVVPPSPSLHRKSVEEEISQTNNEAIFDNGQDLTQNQIPMDYQLPPQPTSMQKRNMNTLGLLGSQIPFLGWVQNNSTTLLRGAALVGIVGSFWYINKGPNSKSEKEKAKEKRESSFERTINSLKQLRDLNKLSESPEGIAGLLSDSKKKQKKKKKAEEKQRLWAEEENDLMKTIDTSFKTLGERPKVIYKMPELPEPRSIKTNFLRDNSPTKIKEAKKISKTKKKVKKEAVETEHSSEEPKKKRIVPVLRRTKRIKKVTS